MTPSERIDGTPEDKRNRRVNLTRERRRSTRILAFVTDRDGNQEIYG
jgi:hypothetical protein